MEESIEKKLLRRFYVEHVIKRKNSKLFPSFDDIKEDYITYLSSTTTFHVFKLRWSFKFLWNNLPFRR